MKKNIFHLLPLLLITSTLSIEQCKAMNESASKVPSLVSLAYNKLPELLEKIDKGDASWGIGWEKPIECCEALDPNLQECYPDAIYYKPDNEINTLFSTGEKIHYLTVDNDLEAVACDQGQFVKQEPCHLYNDDIQQVFVSRSTQETAIFDPMYQQLSIVKSDNIYKDFSNITTQWNSLIDNFVWDSSGKRIAFSCSDDNTYTIIDIESDKVYTYPTDKPISFLSWLPNTDRLIMLQKGGKIGFNDVNGKQKWEEKTYPDEDITHIAPINEKLFAKFSTKNGISFIALKDIHDKSFDKNIIPGLGQPLFVSSPSSSTNSVIAISYKEQKNKNSDILVLLFINSDPKKSQNRFGRFAIDSKIIKGVWSQETPLSTFAFITENQKLWMAFLDGQEIKVEYQNIAGCDPETLCWHPATSSFVVSSVVGNSTKLWKLPYLKPFSSERYNLTIAQSLLLTEFQKNKQLKLCPHGSPSVYKNIFNGEWTALAIKKAMAKKVKKRCSECSQHSA